MANHKQKQSDADKCVEFVFCLIFFKKKQYELYSELFIQQNGNTVHEYKPVEENM